MVSFKPSNLTLDDALEFAHCMGQAKVELAEDQEKVSPGLLANKLNEWKIPKVSEASYFEKNTQWRAKDIKNFLDYWGRNPFCSRAMLIRHLLFGPLFACYLLSLLDSTSLLHAGLYHRRLYALPNQYPIWRTTEQTVIQLASHGIEMALKGLKYSYEQLQPEHSHSLEMLWKCLRGCTKTLQIDAVRRFNMRSIMAT